MDPIRALEAATAQTAPIVAAVTDDEYALPTPCTEWDVRALLNHLLGVLVMWRGLPAGSADISALAGEHIGDDASKAYESLAAETLAAWKADGVVENPIAFVSRELPGDFAARMLAGDIVIHGWDLATATGQDVEWNQELAADVLDWHQEAARIFPPEMRAQSFGAEAAAPAGADAMTQLIAFVGRRT